MKLIKQESRKYKEETYYKYVVFLPSTIIKKIGWCGGEELNAEVHNNAITIKKQ